MSSWAPALQEKLTCPPTRHPHLSSPTTTLLTLITTMGGSEVLLDRGQEEDRNVILCMLSIFNRNNYVKLVPYLGIGGEEGTLGQPWAGLWVHVAHYGSGHLALSSA